MKVDLFSVIQGGKRTISFMSQAVGLIAEVDLGTEHLRWMGDARFTCGLLWESESKSRFLFAYHSLVYFQ